MLRDQAELFGPVASDPTASRVLSRDDVALGRLLQARAAERELAWAQLIETRRQLPCGDCVQRRDDRAPRLREG